MGNLISCDMGNAAVLSAANPITDTEERGSETSVSGSSDDARRRRVESRRRREHRRVTHSRNSSIDSQISSSSKEDRD